MFVTTIELVTNTSWFEKEVALLDNEAANRAARTLRSVEFEVVCGLAFMVSSRVDVMVVRLCCAGRPHHVGERRSRLSIQPIPL